MAFDTLESYVAKVYELETSVTELDVKLADNVDDAYFIKLIFMSAFYKGDHYKLYVLACAFLKLTVRAGRIELAKTLFSLILRAISGCESKDKYINGIMRSALSPPIRRGLSDLVDHIVTHSIEHADGISVDDISLFNDATLSDKATGTKITASLLKYQWSKVQLTDATLNAMKKAEAGWQVEMLVDKGADIDEFTEKQLRQYFGTPKKALLSLTQQRAHALSVIFNRYMAQSKSNPLDYLTVCPEWQKPHILNIIAEY